MTSGFDDFTAHDNDNTRARRVTQLWRYREMSSIMMVSESWDKCVLAQVVLRKLETESPDSCPLLSRTRAITFMLALALDYPA